MNLLLIPGLFVVAGLQAMAQVSPAQPRPLPGDPAPVLAAPVDTIFPRKPITYEQYLSRVGQLNLNLSAERFNVDIADAGIELARVFPDPALTFGNVSGALQQYMNQQWFAQVGFTVLTAGKRRAGIELARSQKDLAAAQLTDFFRNLRADATIAYVNALAAVAQFDRQRQTYALFRQLSDANERLFRGGTVSRVDMTQAQVATGRALNDLYQAEADLKTSLLDLNTFLGASPGDSLFVPTGTLNQPAQSFAIDSLLNYAVQQRADLLVAQQSRTVAERTLTLNRKNRIADLNVALGNNYYTQANSETAPTPSFNAYSATLTVPLKFSNKYRGELRQANYQIQQADLLFQSVRLRIQTEVRQAYVQYVQSEKQVAQFNASLLRQALEVLNGRLYSYRRGASSYVELVTAQQTYQDVYTNYISTQEQYLVNLINLQRSAGIWSVRF